MFFACRFSQFDEFISMALGVLLGWGFYNRIPTISEINKLKGNSQKKTPSKKKNQGPSAEGIKSWENVLCSFSTADESNSNCDPPLSQYVRKACRDRLYTLLHNLMSTTKIKSLGKKEIPTNQQFAQNLNTKDGREWAIVALQMWNVLTRVDGVHLVAFIGENEENRENSVISNLQLHNKVSFEEVFIYFA